jgi:hypothetical protein
VVEIPREMEIFVAEVIKKAISYVDHFRLSNLFVGTAQRQVAAGVQCCLLEEHDE